MASRPQNRSPAPAGGPAHSGERIVEAALALIEQEGLEAFSTRKLASALDLKVMSLYHYFPSREAILDGAVDRMIAEVPLPSVARSGWRQGLLRLARDYRVMGRHHLRAVPLLAQRCPASAPMQAFLDTLGGLLLKSGLRPTAAAHWLLILRDYVVGSLVADHAAALLADELAAQGGPARNPMDLSERERARVFLKGYTAMLDAIERERQTGGARHNTEG